MKNKKGKNRSKNSPAVPTPGSPGAVELGCTCPVMDNHNGKGAWGHEGYYWMSDVCPLHTPLLKEELDED